VSSIRDVLSTPPPALAVSQALSIAREHWGLEGSAQPLGSERDQNFLIDAGAEGRYVFKIINAVYPMRVSAEAELEGLDVPQFGMLAYPESGDEASAAI